MNGEEKAGFHQRCVGGDLTDKMWGWDVLMRLRMSEVVGSSEMEKG